MKTCIACGMPMNKKEDYAMGNENKDYCKYCMREDGLMQSYEEKLVGMTKFIVSTQGIDEIAAREAAKEIMSKLPAWKE
jgi:Putative zinc ribbon domain